MTNRLPLDSHWASCIDIDGLSKEDQQRIRKIGIIKWMDEVIKQKQKGETKVMTTATIEVTTPVKKENVFEKAMLLSVSRSRPTLSKTISKDQFEVAANKKRVHATKDLYKCAELEKITSWDTKVDAYLKTRCAPFPLKNGIYLLSYDLVNEVENKLIEFQLEYEGLVNDFAGVFEQAKLDAKEELGDLFNPSDYPTAEGLKHEFSFNWDYLDFSVAGRLKEINKEVYERKCQTWENTIVEAAEATKQVLCAEMQVLVNHWIDRLTPNGDGKKKIFHDTMLTKLNNFLSVVDSRNLVGDVDLKRITDEAKDLVDGLTTEILRKDEVVRANTQAGFEKIKAQLDSLVVSRPIASI